ncbi:FAD-binding and (Fe-S)-binding domain-containing protein [Capillimicrobium parvum]|nr:FAD-binding and (Fe-S)-binding domain-containing protein [Capillimicrobium parvum]
MGAVSLSGADLQRVRARKRRQLVNRHHEQVEVDAAALARRLAAEVRGDVRFDEAFRAAYTCDSSNYRQAPIGVVCPRDASDVVAAVAVCRAFGAPVTARGAGTSLAGQTTNAAVILDTSWHMRDVLDVDPVRRIARVQPGVVRDQLAKATERDFGLSFPPDTSTHAYATFGGMIANNSCGAHSVMTGRTSDNLRELEVVLYDGARMRVGQTSGDELERIVARSGRQAELYRGLRDLRDRYADEIRDRYPQIPRRASGYNLDDLLPEKGFHVARALSGSEGTLAITLEATVDLTEWPAARTIVCLGYPTIFDAADHVPEVMAHGPMACEAIDDVMVRDMLEQGMHQSEVPMLPDGTGFLLVEFGAPTKDESDARARECLDALSGDFAYTMYDDEADEQRLWAVREGGLGATAYLPGGKDHYEGWEDAAVAPERLGEYLRGFQELLDRYGYDTSKYGHFGQGLVHCRINFGLRSAGGIETWRRFMDDVSDLVTALGGSLSGEHGDGQSRAELLPKMFGPRLMDAFREYKALWDPDWKLNPGKVVEPNALTDDLKLGVDYNPPNPRTHFSFPEDGDSFAHAALRCVGAGKCRDVSSGTMCPSYMATLDEQHTTRGRARVLFEMLRGETITGGWRSDAVHESLDLCLACKGCKGDCPVSVDMATYKAEFLSHHYRRRLRPRPAYAMGLIMVHARLARRMPRLANLMLGRSSVQRLAGLTTEREMPRFATQTFRAWFARRPVVNPDAPPVVLFADTFNDHLHPEVTKAAVEVLEAAGRRVVVPMEPICCGRPLYDYGMLDTAQRYLRGLLRALRPHIRAGTHLVGLEPSCLSVLRDELVNLFPHDEDAKRLSLQALTLAEYLRQEVPDWPLPRLERDAILHVHCHQKAVIETDATSAVLHDMGLRFDGELGAGCCGLAGSFGFEAEKYELSMRIGERRLLPAVRSAGDDVLIVNDGFSCKTQIEHGTERRALHLAQVLKMAMDHGPAGVAGPRPERDYPDVA